MSTLQGLFYYSKFSMEFISNSQIWNCGCYALTVICSLVSKLFDCSMNNKTVVVISIYIVNKSKAVLQILLGFVIFIRLMSDHCLALSVSKSVLFRLVYFGFKLLDGFVKVATLNCLCCSLDLPKLLHLLFVVF